MYWISAPANPASGPFLGIRLRPEFWPDLAGFGGNCISAELDQFLLEPLISHQEWSCFLVEDEHAQVSSVVTTRTLIPDTTTYQRPIRETLQYTAGDIRYDHRCWENAETLIFLKFNSRVLGVWYYTISCLMLEWLILGSDFTLCWVFEHVQLRFII